MPRPSAPWFRASANTWYATIDGRKVSLGVRGEGNRKQALTAWHRLMGGMPLETPHRASETPPKAKAEPQAEVTPATVQDVIDGFLADAESRACPGTVRNYRLFLLPFAKKHGARPAEALTVAEAEAYARKPEWSPSYRNGFLGSLVTAFRWAERQRLIAHNPLNGVRKPPKASRGAKALVSADTHARLVQHADAFFGAFLRLLWLTGARPGEIASLRAEEIDVEQGVAVLTDHKTAHLGKSRVLFLSSEAVAVVKSLDRSQGLLFPGEDGQRLTAQALGRRLARVCEKAKVKGCIAYGYRHSFATDALAKGVPDAQVAALLGHSGTAMLHKHYAHLGARAKALRDALGQVR